MPETKKTFCRFCHVFCGLEVDVEDNRVIAVRGDQDNPVSEGYTCPKGRAEVERINHPDRLRSSQKRVDGQFVAIDSAQAIDEIGTKLKTIVEKYGPESVAVYVGCGGHRTAAGGPLRALRVVWGTPRPDLFFGSAPSLSSPVPPPNDQPRAAERPTARIAPATDAGRLEDLLNP